MNRSLNTAASGMLVQQRNLDLIANNLANVNTTAFKASRAEFQDLMYQTLRAAGAEQGGGTTSPAAQQVGMGAKFVASTMNFADGPLLKSSGELDMAIVGRGFFGVQLPDGTLAYTRDGSFVRSVDGTIVTKDGLILDGNIQVPLEAGTVTVSSNGTVSAQVAGEAEPRVLGVINLYIFPNPAGLERIGRNLFIQSAASGEPTPTEPGQNGAGRIEFGFLEGSNVEMVEEMVRLIIAQRAYEMNSKVIVAADEMAQATNNLRR